jgi:hypothetical protein
MKSSTQVGMALLFVFQLSPLGLAQSNVISTYAGPALPTDGSIAISQAIDWPDSVASDGAGGFYMASGFQKRVYRVDAEGKIKIAAGNGTPGCSGDGGPAASAQLNFPNGITADAAGNLFVADMYNHRIRKVTPAGLISTIAGNGTPGYSGDGGPAMESGTSCRVNRLVLIRRPNGAWQQMWRLHPLPGFCARSLDPAL